MLPLLAGALAAAATAWCVAPPPPAGDPALAAIVQRLTPLLGGQPAPVARVHTEHTLPHEGIRDASIEAEKQLPLMRDAALAWRAGAGDAYLAMAERYLDAWVQTYKPDLNPIDETPFDALIETYALIRPKLPPEADERARRFLADWALAYIDDAGRHAGRSGIWSNNWQSHRVKLVTMIAAALDDDRLWTEARRLFDAQVAANIKPGGEVIDFAERDALHYVLYDLEPLTQAALAAQSRGEDWYHAGDHSSLAAALAWLRPYAAGETPHEEFARSRVAFDAQRAAAGEAGYSGPFEPKRAARLYWMAAGLDPQYAALARSLSPTPPSFMALCGQ